MPWLDFMSNNSAVELNRIKQKKRKIFHIVFHFLFLSFQAYTIKRSTGVQSSVNRSMPDIGAVSPKIDRRGIKIVHPGKVDLMNLGHKLTSKIMKKSTLEIPGIESRAFHMQNELATTGLNPPLILQVKNWKIIRNKSDFGTFWWTISHCIMYIHKVNRFLLSTYVTV